MESVRQLLSRVSKAGIYPINGLTKITSRPLNVFKREENARGESKMVHDSMQAIADAEKAIQSRAASREAMQLEFRGAVAIELIADELTRLHAEASTIRYLLATYIRNTPHAKGRES
jgi:hypothetical protein